MRSIASIAAAINVEERLPKWQRDLVYVDYRDGFDEDQVENLLRGGYCDFTDEWVSMAQWESAGQIVDEWFEELVDEDKRDDLYHEWLGSEERHELIYAIEELDTSQPYSDLMRNTGMMLFRVQPDEDDMAWLDADTLNGPSEGLLEPLGLGPEWLPAVTAIHPEIAGYAAEGGGHFGATLVFRANPADLWYHPDDTKVEIHEPFLWLTNPWSGNGYGEVAKGVTATVEMSQIHTDKAAWGYGADAVFGGLNLDDSKITIKQEVNA